MTTKQHDVTKLPKWVQSEINRLERDLEAAREQNRLQVAREQNRLQVEGDTEVFIRGSGYPRKDHPLPPDSTIVFDMDDGGEIHVDVREHSTGRLALYLYVYGGRGSLAFASGASNTGWAFVLDR